MRKIAIANRKGGVGKSTTAVHLAAGIAYTGKKVLLIDTDAQGNCSTMLGVDPETGLAELLEGGDSEPVEVRENLDLLAGGPDLSGSARLIARKDYDSQYMLSEALEVFDGKYDYVILDTPPGFNELSVNVLFYADEIMVPINMEVLSVQGFIGISQEIEEITKRGGGSIRYILPTMADGRKGLTGDILRQLRGKYPEQAMEPIRYQARMSELPAKGQTIYEHDKTARASLDYAKACVRILDDG